VVIVHRHARAAALLRPEHTGRRERVEGEAPLGDAPVVLAVAGGSLGAIGRAALGVDHLEVGRFLAQLVLREAAWRLLLGGQSTVVQEAHMRGVDVALEDLQPVARQLRCADRRFGFRVHVRFEIRQGWRRRPRAHIRPHDAAALLSPICRGLDLCLEVRLGWFVGHVDAVAVGVEFPAVIDAAQAALFVAPEKQRGATVRAVLVHQADFAIAIAEGDQLFAEQKYAQRVRVRRRKLRGK